ncbi:hypothetical protein BJY04DRAFT_158839 [Aspergillus karnatakaensis]|uniref:uncharacterized protein n=1 Tax=Aspergillus karnatakaensis TaxID=1810916 RepID=UPI003CCD35DA
MHTATLIYFALALTSDAFPLTKTGLNTTIQRRSPDYDIVNVGGIPPPPPPPPPPAVETVVETVTALGAPSQTVTVTIPQTQTQTQTPTPSISPIWTVITYTSSSIAIPAPTSVFEEELIPRGLDRLARAFGKSLDSHLKARDNKLPSIVKASSNETTSYARLSARGLNGTEGVHSPRGLFNATDVTLKARGLNGTIFKA